MGFSDFVGYAERLFTWFWRHHYRVPRSVYWLLFGASVVALTPLPHGGSLWFLAGAGVGLVISVTGIIRWAADHRLPSVVAVPLFSAENDARAKEVQRVIVTTLRDRIGPVIPTIAVRPIDATVDPSDKGVAHRIRRRLRAFYLLYGEVRERKDGGYSVHARLNVEPPSHLEHRDFYTMDSTPQRTIWDAIFHKLSSTFDVEDQEYPFEFGNELQGIIRSVEGDLWSMWGKPDRAETAYRAALDMAGASESHAVDEIRVRLARTLIDMGRENEGLAVMRARAKQHSASPELLRQLAAAISSLNDPTNPLRPGNHRFGNHQEEVRLLRRAVEYRDDSQWDSSRYNLAQVLQQREDTREEALEILENLHRSRSHYAFAWYMKRDRAVAHFQRASKLQEAGRHREAHREYKEAAKWDSRAIRARPKIRLFRHGWRFSVKRYPRSAKMHAAAAEAHTIAGNKLRARYHFFRMMRRRKRLLVIAEPWLAAGDWPAAYAYYEWASIGANDGLECMAKVGIAVCLHQIGNTGAASLRLKEAMMIQPPHGQVVAREVLDYFERRFQLPAGLPQAA